MKTTLTQRTSTVTVGVDGTLASRRAVAWAIDHARPGDTILLVHAWQRAPATVSSAVTPVNDEAAAVQLVEREVCHARLLQTSAGVTILGEAVEGPPEAVLTATHADTVVIGGPHHSPLARALLRPLAARLVNDAHTAVVVVPPTKAC